MRLPLKPLCQPTRKQVVWFWWSCWLAFVTGASLCGAAEPAELSADFAVPIGRIRPLHGINKGPRVPGGLIDLSSAHRTLGIPSIRLHDCGWPNPPVDIHVVFPDPNADPAQATSYDFRLTDDYIAAIQAIGAQVIYRLGESIEHTAVRRYVHPPANPEKWAAIGLGIIRHYNAGWANGFRYGIKYWEIWNEPENRPAMWSGKDEDYFRLYEVTAKAIKREFPGVRVGGPAVGASGQLKGDRLIPTAFVTNFLRHCRQTQSPLDFFSWHCYTDRPAEITERAWAVRRLLDGAGFDATESHLNEWNFLPGNDWSPISAGATPLARKRHYEIMSGAAGAAFLVTSLLQLQDTPIDQCQIFHGELGGFGLFDDHGVPRDNYYGLLAFARLQDSPIRVATRGAVVGQLGIVAGRSDDSREVTLLVANHSDPRGDFLLRWENLPWSGGTRVEVHSLDGTHEYRRLTPAREIINEAQLLLALKAPAVALVKLRPADSNAPFPALKLSAPGHRVVYQRGLDGRGTVPVAGTSRWIGARLEARFVPLDGHAIQDWAPIGLVNHAGEFQVRLSIPGGWYRLEVRARQPSGESTVSSVDRVGVGEVFVVVGHSVAQGGELNLPGAQDDRVNTIALPIGETERRREYGRTGDRQFLPPLQGSQFGSRLSPAPFGHGGYFWAAFGENVVKAQDVPVLILNAAFGGTSLEHWAKSARGETFTHGFVRSEIRMPYRNLQNTLLAYVTSTGLRAILADQGQNDREESDENVLKENYRSWIDRARKDLEFPSLAVVVNRQTPGGKDDAKGQPIRNVQDWMIREHPHCYPGPDYDQMLTGDRPDGIHLGIEGMQKAATWWSEALDAEFYRRAQPFLVPR